MDLHIHYTVLLLRTQPYVKHQDLEQSHPHGCKEATCYRSSLSFPFPLTFTIATWTLVCKQPNSIISNTASPNVHLSRGLVHYAVSYTRAVQRLWIYFHVAYFMLQESLCFLDCICVRLHQTRVTFCSTPAQFHFNGLLENRQLLYLCSWEKLPQLTSNCQTFFAKMWQVPGEEK